MKFIATKLERRELSTILMQSLFSFVGLISRSESIV